MMKVFSLIAAFFAILTVSALPVDNFTIANDRPRLIPEVNELKAMPGVFKLPARFGIETPAGCSYEVSLIDRALKTYFPGYSAAAGGDIKCRLVIDKDNRKISSPEGYELKITASGITITAKSDRGLYYGVQTLCNMIRNVKTPELPCVAINDFPDLSIRGVYMRLRSYNSKEIDLFVKTIEAYGALKYNTLYLEFADNFPYRKNPFTLRKFVISRNDVDKITTAARNNKMKIVPFLQILSHDSWLKTHPKYNSDISEGTPDIPWASSSCPSRPLPRQLNLMAIREQIEYFKPEYFCISLDEISQCPWGKCPECRTKDRKKLWEEATLFYTNTVLELGSIPVIFHDSYYPGNLVGGEKVLAKLDPKVTIVNWDYAVKPDQNRFDYFSKYPMPLLGMSYCVRPENTASLPYAIFKRGLQGVILSYWHYLWSFNNLKQLTPEGLAAAVSAGDAQWRCRNIPVSTWQYDPAYEAMRLFRPDAARPRPAASLQPVSLDKAADTVLGSDDSFPMLNAGMISGLRNELANRPEKYLLKSSGNRYFAAVLSAGNDKYRNSQTVIPVSGRTGQLSFLLAAGPTSEVPAEDHAFTPAVGSIEFIYSNGKKVREELRYRRNINFWNSLTGGPSMRIVSRFNDNRGMLCSLFALDWKNPYPELPLSKIILTGGNRFNIPVALFALSASGNELKTSAAPYNVVKKNFKVSQTAESMATPANTTVVAGFDNGMGKAKPTSVGKFQGRVKFSIVNDPTAPTPGKVLSALIPPPVGFNINRVVVDIDIDRTRLKNEVNSLCFDYWVEDISYIYIATAYLMDTKQKGSIGFFGFTKYGRENAKWYRLNVPLNRMRAESGGTTGEKCDTVRISFFIKNNRQPFTIKIAQVGLSSASGRLLPEFVKDPQPALSLTGKVGKR